MIIEIDGVVINEAGDSVTLYWLMIRKERSILRWIG